MATGLVKRADPVRSARTEEPELDQPAGQVPRDAVRDGAVPAGRALAQRPVQMHMRPARARPQPIAVRGQGIEQRADGGRRRGELPLVDVHDVQGFSIR